MKHRFSASTKPAAAHVVDARGLPIRLGLTAGQTHDGQIADTLLNRLRPRTIVLADKAYDADRIREQIQDQDATPNIPPKSNRRWKPCFSKRLYRERNFIERFFSKLKHFRRVATRYDKLATSFLAMVQLASIRLCRRFQRRGRAGRRRVQLLQENGRGFEPIRTHPQVCEAVVRSRRRHE